MPSNSIKTMRVELNADAFRQQIEFLNQRIQYLETVIETMEKSSSELLEQ